MAVPEVPYDFHDALLETFTVGPGHDVTLRIILYSVFYPGAPTVEVRFGSITNFETVQNYFGGLDPPAAGDIVARIDALNYDTKKKSTEGKLFFYLLLDWDGAINIHCGHFSVRRLET